MPRRWISQRQSHSLPHVHKYDMCAKYFPIQKEIERNDNKLALNNNKLKPNDMKVNFAAIQIQGIEQQETLDLRKQIGNYLYYQSQDLAGSELGKRVYFSSASEGLEITDDERKLLSDAADGLFRSYVVRTAIKEAIGG